MICELYKFYSLKNKFYIRDQQLMSSAECMVFLLQEDLLGWGTRWCHRKIPMCSKERTLTCSHTKGQKDIAGIVC